MPKLLKTFKKNLLFYYVCFLVLFVILYPKIPLFDLIPGYIVRVRIEDFLILFGFLIVIFNYLKHGYKKNKTPLDRPILIYLVIGFLSMLSAVLITKTVFIEPLHSGKMLIHWFRRIEYFSIFYIFYLALKEKRQLKILLVVLFIAVIGVNIYGFGQKYLQWAVYSTMNREFSKGWLLVLTEHARVNSTFAGHYDLAAFLVITLPLSVSMFFGLKNLILKILSLAIFISSLYLMILTASRTSFISYIVALIVLLVFWSIRKKNWKWSLTRGFVVLYLSFFVLLSFGELNERFAQIMGVKQIWYMVGFIREPFKIDLPKHVSLEKELSLVASESDVPPKIVSLPPDVNTNVPEKVITTYITDKFGNQVATTTAVERRYSDAAFEVGLSGAIRLDALWPRAWAAFKKNPLLGTGYSTLTKETVAQFTEAESTDNDYLRALGETGILGFVSFFGIIALILWKVIQKLKKAGYFLIKAKQEKSEVLFNFLLYTAYIAGTVGLLVNAAYIDVFEASKVAFIYWCVTALILRTIEFDQIRK
jgi:O-antigen ligase